MAETYLTPISRTQQPATDAPGGDRRGPGPDRRRALSDAHFQKAVRGPTAVARPRPARRPAQRMGRQLAHRGCDHAAVGDGLRERGGQRGHDGTIPGLRTAAEAARKRLPDAAAAGADFAGNVWPDTTAHPVGRPEASGAVHEGIKSAVANWKARRELERLFEERGEDRAWAPRLALAAGSSPVRPRSILGTPRARWSRDYRSVFVGLHALQMGGDMAHNMADGGRGLRLVWRTEQAWRLGWEAGRGPGLLARCAAGDQERDPGRGIGGPAADPRAARSAVHAGELNRRPNTKSQRTVTAMAAVRRSGRHINDAAVPHEAQEAGEPQKTRRAITSPMMPLGQHI